MRRIMLMLAVLGAAGMAAGALPLKSTTTATVYERAGRAGQLWIDQEIDWKLSKDWTLLFGAEYAGPSDWTFAGIPEKAGGRFGAVAGLPWGMYLDGFVGVNSWFADGSPSTTSAVFEGAWNMEGATWYLGARDRVLANGESTVSITTLRGKWYPNALFLADAKLMLAGESGLGLSPSGMLEALVSPIEAFRPFFVGANCGATWYARNYAEGGGYGTETSLSAVFGVKFDSADSARLTATRRFGGRSADRWEIELVAVKQL